MQATRITAMAVAADEHASAPCLDEGPPPRRASRCEQLRQDRPCPHTASWIIVVKCLSLILRSLLFRPPARAHPALCSWPQHHQLHHYPGRRRDRRPCRRRPACPAASEQPCPSTSPSTMWYRTRSHCTLSEVSVAQRTLLGAVAHDSLGRLRQLAHWRSNRCLYRDASCRNASAMRASSRKPSKRGMQAGFGDSLKLVGSLPETGEWDVTAAPEMELVQHERPMLLGSCR